MLVMEEAGNADGRSFVIEYALLTLDRIERASSIASA